MIRNLTFFWGFIAGPLNVGSFGPNSRDGTFAPKVVCRKAPPAGQANLSPYAGLRFFDKAFIDKQTNKMTLQLKDMEGDVMFSKILSSGVNK
jgi:alkaline phosphatase D